MTAQSFPDALLRPVLDFVVCGLVCGLFLSTEGKDRERERRGGRRPAPSVFEEWRDKRPNPPSVEV